MVVIFLPTARVACRKQDLTATPSISTVQAPHWPLPQPYFVPVRPIESRSTHNSGVSGSASTEYWTPLTRRVNAISEPPLSVRNPTGHQTGWVGGRRASRNATPFALVFYHLAPVASSGRTRPIMIAKSCYPGSRLEARLSFKGPRTKGRGFYGKIPCGLG